MTPTAVSNPDAETKEMQMQNFQNLVTALTNTRHGVFSDEDFDIMPSPAPAPKEEQKTEEKPKQLTSFEELLKTSKVSEPEKNSEPDEEVDVVGIIVHKEEMPKFMLSELFFESNVADKPRVLSKKARKHQEKMQRARAQQDRLLGANALRAIVRVAELELEQQKLDAEQAEQKVRELLRMKKRKENMQRSGLLVCSHPECDTYQGPGHHLVIPPATHLQHKLGRKPTESDLAGFVRCRDHADATYLPQHVVRAQVQQMAMSRSTGPVYQLRPLAPTKSHTSSTPKSQQLAPAVNETERELRRLENERRCEENRLRREKERANRLAQKKAKKAPTPSKADQKKAKKELKKQTKTK